MESSMKTPKKKKSTKKQASKSKEVERLGAVTTTPPKEHPALKPRSTIASQSEVDPAFSKRIGLLSSMRTQSIKSQGRNGRQARSMVQSALGYSVQMEDKELQAKLKEEADLIVKAIEQ